MSSTPRPSTTTSPDDRGRWSSRRKTEAVLRALRGKDLDSLSRELGITAATISGWRDRFLAGGQSAVKSREADNRDEEIHRLRAKVGEQAMEASAADASRSRPVPGSNDLSGQRGEHRARAAGSARAGAHGRSGTAPRGDQRRGRARRLPGRWSLAGASQLTAVLPFRSNGHLRGRKVASHPPASAGQTPRCEAGLPARSGFASRWTLPPRGCHPRSAP